MSFIDSDSSTGRFINEIISKSNDNKLINLLSGFGITIKNQDGNYLTYDEIRNQLVNIWQNLSLDEKHELYKGVKRLN